jgi:hypothetical protein
MENQAQQLKNSIVVVGLDNTMKMAESLLSSGYKVRIKYYDKVDDVDNMWVVRRFLLQYEIDNTDGFPSTLSELFKGYEGPYPSLEDSESALEAYAKANYDPPKPGIKVDDDNVFEKFEVRKD